MLTLGYLKRWSDQFYNTVWTRTLGNRSRQYLMKSNGCAEIEKIRANARSDKLRHKFLTQPQLEAEISQKRQVDALEATEYLALQ